MISNIGNKNNGGFEVECIICGRGEGISLVAHRNKENIVGFIVACRDHLKTVYGGGFSLILTKKEKQ